MARSGAIGRDKLASLRTVADQNGWLDLRNPLPSEAEMAAVLGQHKRARSTISSVQPWRELVARWVGQGVAGTTIYAALCRNHGYSGSYSSVARMVAAIRQSQAPEAATVPLSFAPGEAAQVDFGAGPMLSDRGQRRRTWAFVMTLCFSRHQYLEFVWDQSVPSWLGCHRRAFEFFGAVPRRLIIDNAKCAITRASANDPLVQRAYGECAIGYGFRIDACPPREPQLKGIVEAGVKYVKRSFMPLRQFADMTDLNRQARTWVLGEAGHRVHGTTRNKPLEMFELERTEMLALPIPAPDLGSWHQAKVSRDCHLKFDRALYSAPFRLIGKRLWLRATDCSVALFLDYQHVHTHPRATRAGQRITVADHLPPNARAFLANDWQACLEQARRVGNACATFIELLLAHRVLERLRAAQNTLRLARTYGNARLEAACARAIAHDSIHYRTVKTILAGGWDRQPLEPYVQSAYGSSARFARDADELFTAQHGPLH
ncbi:MAG: IS21 family transposase [Burkholderiaceae bacterium]